MDRCLDVLFPMDEGVDASEADVLFPARTVPLTEFGDRMRMRRGPSTLGASIISPKSPSGADEQTRLSNRKQSPPKLSDTATSAGPPLAASKEAPHANQIPAYDLFSPPSLLTGGPSQAAAKPQVVATPITTETDDNARSLNRATERRRSTGFDYSIGQSVTRSRTSGTEQRGGQSSASGYDLPQVSSPLNPLVGVTSGDFFANYVLATSAAKPGRRRASSADSGSSRAVSLPGAEVHTGGRSSGHSSAGRLMGQQRTSQGSREDDNSVVLLNLLSDADEAQPSPPRPVLTRASLNSATREQRPDFAKAVAHCAPQEETMHSLVSTKPANVSDCSAPAPPAMRGFRAAVILETNEIAMAHDVLRDQYVPPSAFRRPSAPKGDTNACSAYGDAYESSMTDANDTRLAREDSEAHGDGDGGFLAASVFRPPTGARGRSAGAARNSIADEKRATTDFLASSAFYPVTGVARTRTSAVDEEKSQAERDNFLAASLFQRSRIGSDDSQGDEDEDDEEAERLRRTGGGLPQQWRALADAVGKSKTKAGKQRGRTSIICEENSQEITKTHRENRASSRTSSTNSSDAAYLSNLSLLSALNGDDEAMQHITTSFFERTMIASSDVGSAIGSVSDVLEFDSEEDEEDDEGPAAVGRPSVMARRVPVPRLSAQARAPLPKLRLEAVSLMPPRGATQGVSPHSRPAGPVRVYPQDKGVSSGQSCLPPQQVSGDPTHRLYQPTYPNTAPRAPQPPAGHPSRAAPAASATARLQRNEAQPSSEPRKASNTNVTPASAPVAPALHGYYVPTHPPPQPQPNLEGPKQRIRPKTIDAWAQTGWRLEDAAWVSSPIKPVMTAEAKQSKKEKRREAHKRRHQ